MSLTVHDGTITSGSRLLGVAQVGWHRGQCGGVTILRGRCAQDGGEAMVSERTEKDTGVPIGTVLKLGISSDPVADTVRVVGVYDAATADPAVWGIDSPAQFSPARTEGPPDRLDEVVVGEQTMLDTNGDVAAISLRRVDAANVHLSDLPELKAAVLSATSLDTSLGATGPRTLSISGMPEHLDALQPQLDSIAAAAFAVTAQLVLLAWFVLFLVVAATSDERAGEIALAKLRGMSRRATLRFGLAEPVLLVVIALPVGLLLAWMADTVLTRGYLVPGTSVSVTPTVLLALLVCFLGAVSAAALAARGILTAPVLEQLRRTGAGGPSCSARRRSTRPPWRSQLPASTSSSPAGPTRWPSSHLASSLSPSASSRSACCRRWRGSRWRARARRRRSRPSSRRATSRGAPAGCASSCCSPSPSRWRCSRSTGGRSRPRTAATSLAPRSVRPRFCTCRRRRRASCSPPSTPRTRRARRRSRRS